ncbi:aldo/keto reductase [Gloeothece citriformis PCC 7424]|uniref:Aldo/keto reductase n=1 Tax=Gloeothece citriformis (strain PCC 7424) TaxID=65393 RepID=B7KLB4_GLOC7|nr:aldo/keto reductase [Gloeothece citriformis]ACK72486.1 aldo/keto reductase [Gloeothece citriformis PCC 7424]
MQTTVLGKNGPQVTALGIGTWAWGDKLFWNYGQEFGATEVEQAFKATIEAGITFFDTAEVYGLGKSETLLGQFMKKIPHPIDIATKYGPAPWRFGADAVHDALTNSLKRLQLDKVTLYQVHWPFTFFMSQETLMNALASEVERGRISCIGVSNYSAEQMRQAHEILAKRSIPLAVNQVQYSLLYRKIETQGIMATAKDLGITLLAYSPLAQGLLTGKYTPETANRPDGARRFDSRFSTQGLEKIAPVLNFLGELGNNYNKTPAQVALNWLIQQGNVIPIPGAKNASQATQNAGALGWSLSPDDVMKLEQLSRPWL